MVKLAVDSIFNNRTGKAACKCAKSLNYYQIVYILFATYFIAEKKLCSDCEKMKIIIKTIGVIAKISHSKETKVSLSLWNKIKKCLKFVSRNQLYTMRKNVLGYETKSHVDLFINYLFHCL